MTDSIIPYECTAGADDVVAVMAGENVDMNPNGDYITRTQSK